MLSTIVLGFVGIWVLGIYAYITLPQQVPTHFGFDREPTTYGEKTMFITIPSAFSIAPVIFLILTRLRFTLINKYPYLLNLPAFFIYISKVHSERRGLWVNRYFEAILVFGSLLTFYLLILELGIYLSALSGRLPLWFIPFALSMPAILIASLIFYLRKLSKKIKAEIEL